MTKYITLITLALVWLIMYIISNEAKDVIISSIFVATAILSVPESDNG